MTVSGGVKINSMQSGSILCLKPPHYTSDTFKKQMYCLHFLYVYGVKCPDLKSFSPYTSQNPHISNKLARRQRNFSQVCECDLHHNKHRYRTIQPPFCLLRAWITNCNLITRNERFFLPLHVIIKLSHTQHSTDKRL